MEQHEPVRFQEVRELILERTRQIPFGDVKYANRCTRSCTRLFRQAFEEGDGLKLAKVCMEDSESAVRIIGAYFLLPYEPLRALWVLGKESLFATGANKFVALDNKFTVDRFLSDWIRGKLTFPRLRNGEIVELSWREVRLRAENK